MVAQAWSHLLGDGVTGAGVVGNAVVGDGEGTVGGFDAATDEGTRLGSRVGGCDGASVGEKEGRIVVGFDEGPGLHAALSRVPLRTKQWRPRLRTSASLC